MDYQPYLDVLLKLLFAAVMGFIIGYERELHNQPAGLRTHIIVSVGAALIMIVSYETGKAWGSDPGRIAAQVVSGMGFLGAGAIIRYGTSVRGLTTAACLWAVAGVGLAAGAGLYYPALVATLIVFVSTTVFEQLEKNLIRGKSARKMQVIASDRIGLLGAVENALSHYKVEVREMGISKLVLDKKVHLNIMVNLPEDTNIENLTKAVSAIEGVEQFEID